MIRHMVMLLHYDKVAYIIVYFVSIQVMNDVFCRDVNKRWVSKEPNVIGVWHDPASVKWIGKSYMPSILSEKFLYNLEVSNIQIVFHLSPFLFLLLVLPDTSTPSPVRDSHIGPA